MPCANVTIESHGPVAVLRLQREPANAIDVEFAQAIECAYSDAMHLDPRALVITGAGRFFSGGLDLEAVPAYSPEQQRALMLTANRMIAKLYACPVPTVAAVNGHAVAAGLILALSADYRIGPSGDASFGLTEARVGIPFPAGAMVVLNAELAAHHVRYITLRASTFNADEARSRGVFDEVQPADQVMKRALEVACDMASMPADGYRRIKQQLRAAAIVELERINREASDPMLTQWISPEAADACAKLLEGAGDSK